MSERFDGQHAAQGAQPIQQGQRYKFTLEELRTIKECNRESFWKRSMPLCTLFTVGVYAGIKKGILQPSPRFGAFPKVSLAITFGYFLGKLSYQQKCAEKIMQLPNSPLADMLRKQTGRGIIATETMAMEPGFYTAAPSSYEPAPASTEPTGHMDVVGTRPVHNFDTEASNFTGIDYGKMDTTDQMLDDSNLPPQPPQHSQTYEDLRRQNRIEYETRMHSSPGIISRPPTPTEQRPALGVRPGEATPGSAKKKNVYGDVWDDVQNPQS